MRRKADREEKRKLELVKQIREKLMKGSEGVKKWVSRFSDDDLAFIYLKD